MAFFQPCSFGLAISVFACRVLFVLIYSVPARTIHPRFVLAHSVQHFLCVPFLLAFQVQFSNRFLPRSFLSSIFPSVSVSQSLCLSASLAFPVRFSQFSPSLSVTPFMYFSSVYATRPPSSIFSVQSKLRGSLCSIPSSVPASLLFSSILPVCLCLSVPLPVLFVPSRPHPRSGLASVQNCR